MQSLNTTICLMMFNDIPPYFTIFYQIIIRITDRHAHVHGRLNQTSSHRVVERGPRTALEFIVVDAITCHYIVGTTVLYTSHSLAGQTITFTRMTTRLFG